MWCSEVIHLVHEWNIVIFPEFNELKIVFHEAQPSGILYSIRGQRESVEVRGSQRVMESWCQRESEVVSGSQQVKVSESKRAFTIASIDFSLQSCLDTFLT